ncbi:rhodanese-like domain-containing protein [Daejeonella sp.]|uniref:rhodanese-like domain-containing protein n=1 Tax=Daejeonella sp. TaxID=2805397 RepID=UPI003983A974
MFNSFFKNNENDLDGYHFRKNFQNTGNAILVDMRTPEEYKSGTILGSTNIDFLVPFSVVSYVWDHRNCCSSGSFSRIFNKKV